MYDIENYYQASTIEEAVKLLKEHPKARVISGGSDVLIKIREGKMAGTSLVSIRDIREIQGVWMAENKDIWIGAGTTFSHVTADPVIVRHLSVLGEAVDQVGGPQVRNIGTIGGNVCNGAVSADSAPTLFSLNAMLLIRNDQGERLVPIQEFYLGPGKVDLHPGDLLTHIVIPASEYEGYQGHYIKYSMRNAMDIATLSCSVVSAVDQDTHTLKDVRITFGVAAPVPLRCRETEQALIGMEIGEELYAKVNVLLKRTGKTNDNQTLNCGSISLNTVSLVLTVDGKETELPPKEFEILCFLLKHKGWVVSRETLLNRIWGDDVFVETRVVDNHVKNLRKALNNAGRQIKTVVSKGYKLTEE